MEIKRYVMTTLGTIYDLKAEWVRHSFRHSFNYHIKKGQIVIKRTSDNLLDIVDRIVIIGNKRGRNNRVLNIKKFISKSESEIDKMLNDGCVIYACVFNQIGLVYVAELDKKGWRVY